jgi:hypothetical protein
MRTASSVPSRRVSSHSRPPSLDAMDTVGSTVSTGLRDSVVRASYGGLRFVDTPEPSGASREGQPRLEVHGKGSGRSSGLGSGLGLGRNDDSPVTYEVSFGQGDSSRDEADSVGPGSAGGEVVLGDSEARGLSQKENPLFISDLTAGDGHNRHGVARRYSHTPSTGSSVLLAEELKEEVRMLRGLQREGEKAKEELIEALEVEKEKNEARNDTMMGLLEKKDVIIEEMSKERDQASAMIGTLESMLEDERKRGVESEAKVKELMDIRNTLKEELDAEKEGHEADVGYLEDQLMHIRMELDVEKATKEELESNMEEVAKAMDAAEEIIVEMEGQFADKTRGLESRCSALERFIAEKLGIESVENVLDLPSISRYGRASDACSEGGDNSDDGAPGVENRRSTMSTADAALLKANRALEEALIRNAVQTKKVRVPAGNAIEEVAVPLFIRDEKGLEEDTVETLREDVAQLSKALDVAQQVALQAEAELISVLNSQGEASRPADREQEEKWRDDALEKIVDLEESLRNSQTKTEVAEGKVKELEELLEAALGNKEAAEDEVLRDKKEVKDTFLQMQKEMHSLRADLYATQRSLSSREAVVASLQATQKFSLDISDWDSLDVDSIDPSSSPVEFLVKSLQEAAEMQTELLESLSEHAFEREQGRHALQAIERDLERVFGVLESSGLEETARGDFSSKEWGSFGRMIRSAERDEVEKLRSQVEKAVAIQQGQAEAFSVLAMKMRNKEADMKSKLHGYEETLRDHEEFFENLDAAIPAIKSGLAKVALAEQGEAEAEEILGSMSSRTDILELCIVASEKLMSVARSVPNATAASDRSSALERELSDLKGRYAEAKREAQRATDALEELKESLKSAPYTQLIENSPQRSVSMTSGAILGDDLLNFVTRFEEVLDESGRLEDRVRALDEENARLKAEKMTQDRDNFAIGEYELEIERNKAEIANLLDLNRRHEDHIHELQKELEVAHASMESSIKKQSLMSGRFNVDVENLKAIYDAQIDEMKQSATADRDHLVEMMDQAAGEASELNATLKDMEEKLLMLEKRCYSLEQEKMSLERERASFAKGHIRRTDAMSIDAALEQAKQERMERQRVEKRLEELLAKHHNSASTKDTSCSNDEKITSRLREAQMRIEDLDRRLKDSSADVNIKAKWDQDVKDLQDDVVNMVIRN